MNLLSFKIFKAKLSQISKILDKPLVIFNLDGLNQNYKMFTLLEDHSSPAILAILPGGKAHLLVSSIETALPAALSELLTIHAYDSNKGIFEILNEIIPLKKEIFVEISTKYSLFDTLTYGFVKKLKKVYKPVSAESILWELRTIKTNEEIALIKKAINLTYEILNEIESHIKIGVSEEIIMDGLNLLVNKYKLSFSFKPIIAAGTRAFDPHPIRATKRKLKKNDLLILDLGLYYNCYTSDITRTYKIDGDISDINFFGINEEMENKLISLKLSDITPYDLGMIMDDIAIKHGVHSLEKHGYGHGIGVAIHDVYPSIPMVNKKNKKPNLPKFSENMVFAFEPGFYTKRNSFRIENNYVIKNGYAVKL
ncbi:MAG: aminopeptidase P family protein [Candidatus Firestonebacteria bacterium]|nr:aminopeptidase P family protein [Candidatus Firestonebacteria bacterium]